MASELWVCIGIWSSERREQERSCMEALEQKGVVRRERRCEACGERRRYPARPSMSGMLGTGNLKLGECYFKTIWRKGKIQSYIFSNNLNNIC